jgi:S1-C subfamily serine protease
MRRTAAFVLVAALVGGLVGASVGLAFAGGDTHSSSTTALGPAPIASTTPVSESSRAATMLSPEAIYRAAAPGVVVISDKQNEVVPPTFFTPGGTEKVGALGSGFVVDAKGDIVTNDHVVQGASDIRVGFSGGAQYPAKIVGTDPSSDIAVIRVEAPASALHPLAFGDSGTAHVGDAVYAIGNPFGLERTMTAGIVSATGRDIQAPNGLTIRNAIQTDAPINHGNSGGPLLDREGRVIGVNAQIQGGTVDANVGIGFAIPSSSARSVAQQLVADGHARHPWLGAEIETIDPSVSKIVRGLPPHGVAIVKVVEGSPAEKAGLRASTKQVTVDGVSAFVGGDVIVAVDGKPVASSTQLGDRIAEHETGDTIRLEVVRDGATRSVAVTLGNVPG